MNGFMNQIILRFLQIELLMNNDITLKGLIWKLKETLGSIRENAIEKACKDYWNHFTNAGRA
jgi:hypothetical protein